MSDTIFGLSTGSLPSGIAVVRVSGPSASQILTVLTKSRPLPRQATLAAVIDPETDDLLDHGLVLWFPEPASFTGEDVAEFQIHGSRAIVAALLRCLGRFPGARMASPGEFSRRAFVNGRLDLTEAEGLADLLTAETDVQRRQALAQAGGALRRRVGLWRSQLLELSARLAAALDFSDEADVPADVSADFCCSVRNLADDIQFVLGDAVRGALVRNGALVVIAGPPNAGKSTLLNALARYEAAIVSNLPGTTRDLIEVSVDFFGIPVIFVDTAGLRETTDPVEVEGMSRALRRASDARAVVWLSEDGVPPPRELQHSIRIRTKCDLGPMFLQKDELAISARTGAGLDALVERLISELGAHGAHDPALVTQERQRACLENALGALHRIPETGLIPELAAEDLRLAIRQLDGLVGGIGVEDVLGEIFGRFCIGK